MNEAGVDRCN